MPFTRKQKQKQNHHFNDRKKEKSSSVRVIFSDRWPDEGGTGTKKGQKQQCLEDLKHQFCNQNKSRSVQGLFQCILQSQGNNACRNYVPITAVTRTDNLVTHASLKNCFMKSKQSKLSHELAVSNFCTYSTGLNPGYLGIFAQKIFIVWKYSL